MEREPWLPSSMAPLDPGLFVRRSTKRPHTKIFPIELSSQGLYSEHASRKRLQSLPGGALPAVAHQRAETWNKYFKGLGIRRAGCLRLLEMGWQSRAVLCEISIMPMQ